MPTQSRFGVQPARQVLVDERWTQPGAADQINVPRLHLRGAVNGHVPPSQVVRDRLPALLGKPLSQLFTEESLAAKYRSGRGQQHRKRNGQPWPTSWDQS